MINRRDTILGLASFLGHRDKSLSELVSTRAILQHTMIPTSALSIKTSGYSRPGDGGAARFVRSYEKKWHPGSVQSADGAYWQIAEEIVTPEMFGAAGDGSDQTSALFAMAEYGRAIHHLHVRLTAGRTYAYTNPLFLNGIRDRLIIEGEGASFQNIRASVYGVEGHLANHECLVFPTVFYNRGQELIGTGANQFVYGSPIRTVFPGSIRIKIKDEKEIYKYIPGTRALIYGFAMQEGGFPNTSRYFEYINIVEVKGLEIRISAPLRYGYYEDWPMITDSGIYRGPPRVLPLSRSGFQETKLVQISRLHLKSDPAWLETKGGSADRNGRLQAGNAELFRLSGVTGDGGMYVVSGQNFIDEASCFRGEVEVDKFIDHAKFKRVRYGSFSQGTGCKNLLIEESIIEKMNSIDALEKVVVRNSQIKGQLIETPRIFNGTFGTPSSLFVGNRILSYRSATSMRGDSEVSAWFEKKDFKTIEVYIEEFKKSLLLRVIITGTVLYDVSGVAVFKVMSIPRQRGRSVFMEGKFISKTYSSGYLFCSRYPFVESFGNILYGPFSKQVPASDGTALRPLFGIRRDQFARPERWLYTSDLQPRVTHSPCYFRPGLLVDAKRMIVKVTKPYTGRSPNVVMRIRRPNSPVTFAQIDLITAGTRVLQAVSNNGMAGKDLLLGLDGLPIGILEIGAEQPVDYRSAAETATWSIILEGKQIIS